MKAIKQLETIVKKLEIWQAKYPQHDQQGLAREAKSRLLHLLNEIEDHR
jgi:hypothetical protein